jgi:pimeloyl-ACP methyl ester carboxylesterase
VPTWLIWLFLSPLLIVALLALTCVVIHIYYRTKFLEQVIRIFEERPLFVIPRGQPVADAELVKFSAFDGTQLSGCYLRHRAAERRGVILFGLEFGSNCWASVHYCEQLREAGFDIFAYEPRNQGESEFDKNYNPMQWVTNKDVADGRAAALYLKQRPDADPRGYGIFGVSKGGSVGIMLAATDPDVRGIVTDGAFATYTTVVPYMRRWVSIYSHRKRLQKLAPDFLYGSVGLVAMNKVAKQRRVIFPWTESALRRLRCPILMIHGQADNYIKPEMAEVLYAKCKAPDRELWLVPKAKHNQSFLVAPDDYNSKIVEFFERIFAMTGAESDSLADEAMEVLPRPRQAEEVSAMAAARELVPQPRLA